MPDSRKTGSCEAGCTPCDCCAQALSEVARLQEEVEKLTAQNNLLRKIAIHLGANITKTERC